MGIVLMFLWAAYPFTLYAPGAWNSNDSLVAFLLVLGLLAVRSPAGRGVAGDGRLAGFAARATRPLAAAGLWRRRSVEASARVVAFTRRLSAVTAAIVMLPASSTTTGSMRFWARPARVADRSRTSPFSIWGPWVGLKLASRHLLEGFTIALAVMAGQPGPRKRTVVEVGSARRSGGIPIAFQLGLTHWFYLYIPWRSFPGCRSSG